MQYWHCGVWLSKAALLQRRSTLQTGWALVLAWSCEPLANAVQKWQCTQGWLMSGLAEGELPWLKQACSANSEI